MCVNQASSNIQCDAAAASTRQTRRRMGRKQAAARTSGWQTVDDSRNLKSSTHWQEVGRKMANVFATEDESLTTVHKVPAEIEAAFPDDTFVASLGTVMARWVEAGTDKLKPGMQTPFDSMRVPTMSITKYIHRIHKYFFCSEECLVLALVYIDRLMKTSPALAISKFNVHRLVVVAVMLGAKFLEDQCYGNQYYAAVGGVSVTEMNSLETMFLKMLDWKMFVTPEECQLYRELLSSVTTNAAIASLYEPEPEP